MPSRKPSLVARREQTAAAAFWSRRARGGHCQGPKSGAYPEREVPRSSASPRRPGIISQHQLELPGAQDRQKKRGVTPTAPSERQIRGVSGGQLRLRAADWRYSSKQPPSGMQGLSKNGAAGSMFNLQPAVPLPSEYRPSSPSERRGRPPPSPQLEHPAAGTCRARATLAAQA